jgi:hypothetical protein
MCDVQDCGKPVVARGLCHKHYKRWQINGHTGITNGKGCTNPRERFALQTKRAENGCLEWQGSVAINGYGQTKWNYRYFSAHKFSWTLHKGPVPPKLLVLHKCDNKLCVDPEHLYLGTTAQNTADAIARGQIKTGVRSNLSKFTAEQLAEARSSGEPIKMMATRLGVHWASLYRALKRRVA